MEGKIIIEREEATLKNVFVIYLLFASTFAAFFAGDYFKLNPTLFITGLFLSVVVCIWASMQMKFSTLTIMMLVTLSTAVVDEYAHTSAGAFTYFDGGLPSPLTVFGWSLLILGMLTIAHFLNKVFSDRIPDTKAGRLIPSMLCICLVLIGMAAQGYLPQVSWLLASVYIAMTLASLYYSNAQATGWNLSVMICSVLVGVIMESLGAMEGLWSFYAGEPLLIFMAFTWSLRTWTVLSVSRLFNANYQFL